MFTVWGPNCNIPTLPEVHRPCRRLSVLRGGSAPKIHQKGYLKTGVETDAQRSAQRRPKHLQMAPETEPKATSGAFRDDFGATLTEKCALSQNPHFYYGLATFTGAQRPHFRVFSHPKAGQEAAKDIPENVFKTAVQKCRQSPPRAPRKRPKSGLKVLKNQSEIDPGGHRALGVPPGGAQAPTQPQNDPKSYKIFDFSTATVTSLEAAYKQQPRRGQSPGRAQILICSTATVTSLATAYKRRARRRQSPGSAHLSICSPATVTSLETVYKKRSPRRQSPRSGRLFNLFDRVSDVIGACSQKAPSPQAVPSLSENPRYSPGDT